MRTENQIPSEWRRLFNVACSLIDQVNEENTIIDRWTFGGGTAMMIQIDHRESHDVDIFFENPGYLQFLNPETQNFRFEIMPGGYEGDGSHFRKFSFSIGEIDFITASNLTEAPTIELAVEGRQILLETVPEIITKKIYHRGGSIKARDIFDVAAAARVCEAQIVDALKMYPDETKVALATIEKLNPQFIADAIAELMVKEKFRNLQKSALDDTKQLLSSIAI